MGDSPEFVVPASAGPDRLPPSLRTGALARREGGKAGLETYSPASMSRSPQ